MKLVLETRPDLAFMTNEEVLNERKVTWRDRRCIPRIRCISFVLGICIEGFAGVLTFGLTCIGLVLPLAEDQPLSLYWSMIMRTGYCDEYRQASASWFFSRKTISSRDMAEWPKGAGGGDLG
jgi:hypothetical protein